MHIKKLLVREVLILHQSSYTKVVQNDKKKIYISCLRKSLETYLVSTASTIFGIINYFRLIRENLESYSLYNYRQGLRNQLCSYYWYGLGFQSATTTSSFFTNFSDIHYEVIPSFKKALGIGYALWHRYYYRTAIKGLTPTTPNLCKYTQEIVSYMILTGKKHLGPHI